VEEHLIEGKAFLFHLPSYLFIQPSDFHLPPAQELLFRGSTGLVGVNVVFIVPISHLKASIHPFHDLCKQCHLFFGLGKDIGDTLMKFYQ